MIVPETASLHFEIAKLMVEIYSLNKSICNTIVSDSMLHQSIEKRIEGHQKFALIWRLFDDLNITDRVFEDGIFLMLDSIKSDNPSLKLIGRSWLLSAMTSINRFIIFFSIKI